MTMVRHQETAHEQLGLRLQTVLDSVQEGILGVDSSGVITFGNRAAFELLSTSPDELYGRPHHEVLHPSVSPADCSIAQTLRDGRARVDSEDTFARGEDSSIPVTVSVNAILDAGEISGAVITFRDISDQRRSEDEARRALMELVQEQAARAEAESMRGQLHRLFQQAPALVALTYGPDHVFELANPRYLELVGGRDIVGKPVSVAMPEVVEQGFIDLLDEVYRSGEPFLGNEVPVVIVKDDGPHASYVNFVYQPLLGADGRAYGILVHAVDVTEQVNTRQQIEEKAAELSMLAAKLERTNRELDQFAYIASHDLKAPLRGVSNIASWLEEDLNEKLTDESREFVALMKSRVARMEDLINALLTYSRAGRVHGDPRAVDVGALVKEVIEVVGDQRDIVSVETGLPVLQADPIGLQQVFQNLISNALKYARSQVRIGAVEGADTWKFYVADDGPGIDPRFHEKIWGMFQRLHAPGEGEGTGIGLAIVRKIVEASHARAWIESTEGAGTTFWVEWPKLEREDS